MTLNEHIENLICQHVGGEAFFDELDNSFRTSTSLMEDFCNIVMDFTIDGSFVVSGNFGRAFVNYLQANPKWKSHFKKVICVNGGLRSGNKVDCLESFVSPNEDFIFLDDSFYKGRTRDVIKKEIERNGGHLIHTFVFYDGAKEFDGSVSSLYRYFDNH